MPRGSRHPILVDAGPAGRLILGISLRPRPSLLSLAPALCTRSSIAFFHIGAFLLSFCQPAGPDLFHPPSIRLYNLIPPFASLPCRGPASVDSTSTNFRACSPEHGKRQESSGQIGVIWETVEQGTNGRHRPRHLISTAIPDNHPPWADSSRTTGRGSSSWRRQFVRGLPQRTGGLVANPPPDQIAAAVEGYFWPKIFWDFLTKTLDGAVKPIPILQTLNLVFGLILLAWEWPLGFLAGSSLHRSLEARLAFLPLTALAAALTYQGTNAAIYQVIGLGVYFWAYSEGEVRIFPPCATLGSQKLTQESTDDLREAVDPPSTRRRQPGTCLILQGGTPRAV